jgi:hypothetical protein
MKIKNLWIVPVGCALLLGGYALRGLRMKSLDLTSTAQAQDQSPKRCSLKTIKGAYGIKFEGQKIGFGPLVSVSRIVFDGNGTFTTTEIARLNGNLIQRTFTGPYVVNEDCTGFIDFSSNITNPPHEAHGDFVIVNNGQEFFIVDNEEGWAASGIGKKIN